MRLMRKAMGKSNKELPAGCLALFGLPFLAAGLFMSGLYFSGFARWWESRSWVETPCWIESAELKTSHGDSTTYKAMATYRYEFGGRTYHGDRVSLGSGSDNIGRFQQEAHRELSRHVAKSAAKAERDPQAETGAPFRCFVNPASPSESVLYRTLRWEMQAFMAIFALTFPAVGAGLVFGGWFGTRIAKREAELRSAHPGEPWKWKTAWSQPAIPESTTAWKTGLHLYTLWSGIIIVTLVAATAMSGAFATDRSAWLLTIFVALWAIPLSVSIRALRHRLAVGATRFEPAESPAWPGGALRGAVLLEKPLPLRGTAELSLVCERSETSGSGDSRTTTTEKVWSDHKTVPQDMITRDLTGFRLPVDFQIPGDAPESLGGGDAPVKHTWKLGLKVPGTPIHSVFEIPVFRTAKSPAVETAAPGMVSIANEASVDLPALLAARRITAEFDHAGHPVTIVCPPGRHLSLIVFLIIFDLIWTAAAIFLIQQQAPLVFRIVWPLSAAAIWLIVFWNVLHKRSVKFNTTGLELRNQLGPYIRTRVFEKSRITGFSHDTNMTSNNTRFYRVRLEDVMGKRATLADGITEATTAAALVTRLESWKKAP
jgi:hypothetical protein